MATPAKLELVHTQLGFDLLIDPNDYLSLLLIRDGVFEVPESDLLTRILRAGDVCIDAGCHLGYYSCLAGKLVGEKGRIYAFDANPHACEATRRNLALNGVYSADVIQAALAEQDGNRTFYVSSDDQTGLSSLGPIPTCKRTISVPCLRLDQFLQERRLSKIRLLKLDVEGAEGMVLAGLGRFLAGHVIDFILIECFDERLQLLNTSAEAIAEMLKSAGYTPWEFGTENAAGWSRTTEVPSRGDCNYLFSSPSVTQTLPSMSLAAALLSAVAPREQLLSENAALKQQVTKLEEDTNWLLSSIKAYEEATARLAAQKQELETISRQIQASAGWRMLNKWRKIRDRLVPESTRRRKLYDALLGKFRARN